MSFYIMLLLYFVFVFLLKVCDMSLLSRFRNQYTYSSTDAVVLLPEDYDDEFVSTLKQRATKPSYWPHKVPKKKVAYANQINNLQYKPKLSQVSDIESDFDTLLKFKPSKDSNKYEDSNQLDILDNAKLMKVKPSVVGFPVYNDDYSIMDHIKTSDMNTTTEYNNWLRFKINAFTSNILSSLSTTKEYEDIMSVAVYRPTQTSPTETTITTAMQLPVKQNDLLFTINDNSDYTKKTWKSYFPTTPLRNNVSININLFTNPSTKLHDFLYLAMMRTARDEFEILTPRNLVRTNSMNNKNHLLFFDMTEDIKKLSKRSNASTRMLKPLNKSGKSNLKYKFILVDDDSTIKSTTSIYNPNVPKGLGKKCYTCGLNDTGLGSPLCHKIFDSPFRSLKQQPYKTSCSGETFIGGCFRRYLDLGKEYNERGCRHFPPLAGKSFASKRFVKLESLLKGITDDCISSPYSSLTPFSRSISLYARYTACVCSRKYCNKSSFMTKQKTFIFFWLYLIKSLFF